MTPLVPACRPQPSTRQAVTAAVLISVLPGLLGVGAGVGGVLIAAQPISALWLLLLPIVFVVAVVAVSIISAWRAVWALPSAGQPERLLTDRVVLDGGRARAARTLLLHEPELELRYREAALRRTGTRTVRPRTLVELVGPAEGRGRAALLLADLPAHTAPDSDPPGQARPRPELAAIAAAVAASPHPAGQRVGERIETLIPGLPR